MEKLLELAPYWIPVALLLATSLANYLTVHHSSPEVKGTAEALLKVIERLSLLVSKDVSGVFKLPGTDKEPHDA